MFFSVIWNSWLVRTSIIFYNDVLDWVKLVEDLLINATLWVKDFTGSLDFTIKDFVYNIGSIQLLKLSKVRFIS